jgi:hypothetical protein
VRARYSAFALGDGEYLYATLAHDHPDRAADPEAADARIAELARAGRALKYMGVVVSDETETEALFLAKVFERGQDRSFAELSTFTRSTPEEGGGLRYAGGTLLPRAALPRALADGVGLRRDAFLALAATHKDTVRMSARGVQPGAVKSRDQPAQSPRGGLAVRSRREPTERCCGGLRAPPP